MEATLNLFLGFVLCFFSVRAAWPDDSPLIVNTAPSSPQPYVLPHNQGYAFYFNGQVVRLIVANETSEGTFTMAAANSGFTIPAAIHNHHHLMEALYVAKGSLNFWAEDQGRTATRNDFHMLTEGNNHTYSVNDPDSELLTAFQPGGIEKYFITLGAPYNSSTNSPYNPSLSYPINGTEAFLLGPQYDTYFQPSALRNNAFTNGTTADGLPTWHVANTSVSLPGKTVPYFLPSNQGPKYLNRTYNTIIQPLATAQETAGRVTIGTIALPRCSDNTISPAYAFSAHQAFSVLEGQLTLAMSGSTVNLIPGDTAFVPANTQFRWWSTVAWTKFYAYAPRGTDCLVATLIAGAQTWGAPVWPVETSD